ncbi:hypothetical protein [Microseira wollei]|nr:hypothetical protein [Microseira wollei]
MLFAHQVKCERECVPLAYRKICHRHHLLQHPQVSLRVRSDGETVQR